MKLKEAIAKSAFLRRLHVEENVPLAQFSTLKVGGPARYLIMPRTKAEIIDVQAFTLDNNIPLHILSGGSNTLFSDEGFCGIVLKLHDAFDVIEPSFDGLSMRVGAAASFAKVTKMAVARGWAHAVGWSGTPGLIGGAVRMNAGTRMGEIKDAIDAVAGIHLGQEIIFSRADIEFGYRTNSLPSEIIIHEVCLSYPKFQLESVTDLELKVQEYRRRRRQTQPNTNSLGSFFKNPQPHFAAQLIEKCNLKGLQYRSAQISPVHANFLVNNGGASADDILYIASIAQKTVLDQCGILLIPEVRMVGNFTKPLLQIAATNSDHKKNIFAKH